MTGLMIAACATAESTRAADTDLVRPAVKAAIDRRTQLGINHSIAIGVFDRGRTQVYARGPAGAHADQTLSADSVFEIGSVTKTFTGLLLAVKVTAGQLALSTPLADIISELPATTAKTSLVALATHTASLPRNPDNLRSAGYEPLDPFAHYTPRMLLDALRSPSLRAGPPKVRYSNLGFGALGYLLGQHENRSYVGALTRHVLRPLGMRQTTSEMPSTGATTGHVFHVPVPAWRFDATAGAGTLKSSVSDMLLFVKAQLGDSPLRAAVQLSQQTHFATPKKASEDDRKPQALGVGLAWGIYALKDGATLFRHNGGTGGFRSFVGFIPKRQIGVVVLTNSAQTGVDDLGLHQLLKTSPLRAMNKAPIAVPVSRRLEAARGNGTSASLEDLQTRAFDTDFRHLNLLGYTYLKAQRTTDAIATFVYNTLLHPHSADAFDSLCEAYLAAETTEEALQCYRRVLEIDTNYPNAAENARRLEAIVTKKSEH